MGPVIVLKNLPCGINHVAARLYIHIMARDLESAHRDVPSQVPIFGVLWACRSFCLALTIVPGVHVHAGAERGAGALHAGDATVEHARGHQGARRLLGQGRDRALHPQGQR